MSLTISDYALLLQEKLGDAATVAKTGKLGNITVRPEMLPKDTRYADVLVYLSQLFKHYVTLHSRGLLPASRDIDTQVRKKEASGLKIIGPNYCEQVFTALYPTSANFKSGTQRIWLHKPWLAEGLSSQVALKELSLLSLKKLHSLRCMNSSDIASVLMEPLFVIVEDIVLSICSPRELNRPGAKLKFKVPLETPPSFLSKIIPETRMSSKGIPETTSEIPAHIKPYLVELSNEQSALVGKTVKVGDMFKVGNRLYISKKRQTMLPSLKGLALIEL